MALAQRLTHQGEGDRQLPHDKLSLEPEHPIAEPSELSIAASVRSMALLVTAPIDFDHQLRLRSSEVSMKRPIGYCLRKGVPN